MNLFHIRGKDIRLEAVISLKNLGSVISDDGFKPEILFKDS